MRQAIAGTLSLGWLILWSTLAVAQSIPNLHSAVVPVADQGETARAEGAREALSVVFVKVSGSAAVLADPVIQTTLAQANRYVQQYAYVRSDAEDGTLAARFEFDASQVKTLLTEAGAPLWTANRPAVVVWLVAEGEQGKYFVTREGSPELVALMLAALEQRGVPVRMPLYDLQDTAALGAQQAWQLRAAPVVEASKRYGVDDVLIGRVTELSSGEWAGDWAYLAHSERFDRSVGAGTVDAYMAAGSSLVAEEMAARFAVSTSALGGGAVTMHVNGIRNFADYAALVTWLEGLELISHANVEWIAQDQLELRLAAQGDAAQLAAIVELNERLQPLPVEPGAPRLSYQWLP